MRHSGDWASGLKDGGFLIQNGSFVQHALLRQRVLIVSRQTHHFALVLELLRLVQRGNGLRVNRVYRLGVLGGILLLFFNLERQRRVFGDAGARRCFHCGGEGDFPGCEIGVEFEYFLLCSCDLVPLISLKLQFFVHVLNDDGVSTAGHGGVINCIGIGGDCSGVQL